MNISITEIFKRIDLYLDRDVFGLDENKKGPTQKQQREFVKYLVSVATHPIGLRASVKPYNCSQEDMLLYLMDMFDLTGTKLRAITMGKNKSKFIGKNSELDIQPVKRHSWRPELKIRLHPPTFFYNERLFLENLHVRVFLITEDRSRPTQTTNDLKNLQDAKAKGMLNKIFKKIHPASSNRIRPMEELSQVVKFERDKNLSSLKRSSSRKISKADYRMTQIIKEQGEVKGDIHLNIRRYYCEPQYSYMLRFEFWLNSDVLRLNWCRKYKRFMRQIIPGNFSRCSKASNQFTNQFRDQEFYGFINIKLANLPSYATKQTYPILSLKERRVNNCEISLELKNRRIFEDNTEKGSQIVDLNTTSSNLMTKKSNESFLINHVRLYSSCILYQCLSLEPSNYHTLADSGKFRNITLDNLLYLPGHTLINQHRLQSNISHFEDQCIRRVSILMLLIKLEIKQIDDTEKIIDYVKNLLISLVQNEYAIAHRLIDEKTLQEVDPFRDGFTSANENFISELELLSLKNFLNMFLIPRSDRWLLKLDNDSSSSIMHRTMTLSGLKLFKTALVQLKRRNKVSQHQANSQTDILELKHSIEQHLCKIIIEHIRMRLETIIHTDPTKLEKVGRTRRNKPLSSTIEDDNLWLQLLHDIRYIQHDLTLYWSRKGLNSLIEHEQPFVKQLGLFEKLERMNLSSIIETKLENYLRHKDRIIN